MRLRPLSLLLLAAWAGVVGAETLPASASAPVAQQAPATVATVPALPASKAPVPTAPIGAPVAVPAPGPAAAAAKPVAAVPAVDDPNFPHLPVLKHNVAFWTKVFADYSENQSVIHSTEDLRRVYTVLDFRSQAAVMDPGVLASLRAREEKQAKIEIDLLLRQVDALKDSPEQMNTEQRRVYDLFSDSSDPRRFVRSIGTWRSQRGLRERTMQALAMSGRYMPEMERIFVSHGLPPKLTRLPLVESSFRVDAYSRAAAAGLWQFIPSSARIYMRLNNLVDDRRDPWTSTDAAARHLKDDYEALGNWPLALTAYNYGRAGIARGLTKVGGTTLSDLIQRFDSDRWGFASQNYYAEFVAALDIDREYQKHFGEVMREAPVGFDVVTVQDYVPYETLRRVSGMDREQFRVLNPAYRDEVMAGRLYVPPGHTLRVPSGSADRFRAAYASLTPGQRFDHQRQLWITYKVGHGERIDTIAARHGVSVRQILASSGFRNAKRVRAGSLLRIPVRDDTTVVASAEPAEAAPAVRAVKVASVQKPGAPALRVHRVTSGQTLGGIAQRYRTTIEALRKLNGLGRHEAIQIGEQLKVPAA